MFCITACQSLSTRGAHPTIERSIRFLTTSSFWSWIDVKGQVIFFDFAPACPKAALFGAQAMWDQNVSEWSKTLQNHHSTASTTPDPGQGYTTGPTVEIACVPQACWSKGQIKRPNKIMWMMTESKSFKRSLKDTCRFRSVSLCSLNFIQAIWLRDYKSTMVLFRRSPDNFLPTYFWFFPPCSTSIISPPIPRNIGAFKFAVVKILVMEVFKFKPTVANSSTKHATIVARSLSLLAYSIKSSA